MGRFLARSRGFTPRFPKLPAAVTTSTDTDSKSTRENDFTVVRLAIDGSRDARAALATRLKVIGRIVTVLNRRHSGLLSAHDLEDVIQDTVAAVLSKLATFRGECALETWVYSFCVNVFQNARRKHQRRRRKESFDGAEMEDETWPEDRTHEREAIESSLLRVGPPASEVIRERVFLGWTFAEIGSRRNVAEATIKTWYYRGIKELGALLAKDQAT